MDPRRPHVQVGSSRHPSDRRPGRPRASGGEPGPMTTGGDHGSPLSRGGRDVNALDRSRRRLASFRQNAPPSPALMLRSRALRPRAQIFNAPWRGVSKHEDSRTSSFETAASPPPQDEVTYAHAESAARRRTVLVVHLTMSNSPRRLVPARVRARVSFRFTHRIEGWAERREAHLLHLRRAFRRE